MEPNEQARGPLVNVHVGRHPGPKLAFLLPPGTGGGISCCRDEKRRKW